MGAAASTCPVSPAITIIILIVVALVVGLLLVLLWKCCCRHPAAGEGGGDPGCCPQMGGLWVGRGTCFGADGSVFPSRGQQRPGQKVRPSGGESCWGLCSVPASLAAPPGRLGERAGGCGRAKRGSPAAPPPRGLVSPPRLGVSSLAALCFSPPQHYLVLQLTRMLAGRAGDADNIRNEHLSQDQERGLLPAVGAPDAPGLEVGHRAPPLGRALSLSFTSTTLISSKASRAGRFPSEVSILSSFRAPKISCFNTQL